MIEHIRKFEKMIILTLIVMMVIVLFLSTIELGWAIIKDVMTPPVFLLDIDELLDLFGLFMLVLIGMELLETIVKTYLKEEANHAQIVMAVGIIAISRKVIILDVKELSGLTLIGIAAIIIALTGGYFLMKRSSNEKQPGAPE